MKYRILLTLLLLVNILQARTLHTVMMCNMNDKTLAVSNQANVKETRALMSELCSLLGYRNHFIIHSYPEFTYNVLDQELNNLKVDSGDVVIYYYASHGVNWSDSEWPHMAFSDRQFAEQTVYERLLQNFSQAKLILCIADCCNMDEEGLAKQKRTYGTADPKNLEKLFVGFEGHRAYMVSASIRGQYSWAWTGGSRPGSIFSIAFRDAIMQAARGEILPSWDYVLEKAKTQTLYYTEQKQMPQYTKNRW